MELSWKKVTAVAEDRLWCWRHVWSNASWLRDEARSRPRHWAVFASHNLISPYHIWTEPDNWPWPVHYRWREIKWDSV